MHIYEVRSRNYKVPSDTMALAYFSTIEKAIDFCNDYLLNKHATEISYLPPNLDEYKFNYRFEYTSNYGSYPCALELVPIYYDVQV